MPDLALEGTQRQFVKLIDRRNLCVRLKVYSLQDLPVRGRPVFAISPFAPKRTKKEQLSGSPDPGVNAAMHPKTIRGERRYWKNAALV
jgi:hypothetical protein